MTKKKTLWTIVIFLFACALALSSAFLIKGSDTAQADFTTQTEIKEEYTLGETLEVPKATLLVDGKEYNATAVVYYPSGTATRLSSITLSEEGKYTLLYTATVNGQYYEEKFGFVVNGEKSPAAAKIAVDLAGYTEKTLPKAIKGEKYSLFSATAKVGNTATAVTSEVFYLYGEKSSLKIATKNGAFTPDRVGTYQIVYTAYNFYGEKATQKYSIEAVDDAEKLSATLTETSLSAVAAKSVQFSYPTANEDNRFGNTLYTLTAEKDGERLIIADKTVYQSAGIGYTFQKTGSYKLTWTVSDYVRTATIEAKANVSAPEATFVDEDGKEVQPTLEKTMFAGKTYSFPDCYLKTYDENGMALQKCDKAYKIGDGAYQSAEGYITLPTNAAGTLTIKWSVGEKEQTASVSVGSLTGESGFSTANLFIAENSGYVSSTDDGVLADLENAGVLTFAYKVHTGSFDCSLLLDGFSSGAFVITLTDTKNAAQKLTLTFTKSAGVITANAGSSTATVVKNGEEQIVVIGYAAQSNALTINDIAVSIPSSFSGFSSGAAYMTIKSSDTGVKLTFTRLNGQRLSTTRDNISPRLNVSGSLAASYETGSEVQLLTAYGLDVFDGIIETLVTVTNADTGALVMTADGRTAEKLPSSAENITIQFAHRGRYRIQYTATDNSGNSGSEVMYITIAGSVPPVITVQQPVQKIAQVGDTLVYPTFSATAAEGGTELFVVVYDPDDKPVYLYETDKYTLSKAGSYKIVVGAFDEDGNMSIEYYYVEVIA